MKLYHEHTKPSILYLSLGIALFLIIINYFLPDQSLLFFIFLVSNFITILIYFVPRINQRSKDKKFRNKFKDKHFFIFPRLYKGIRWKKIYYTGKYLKNSRELLPSFFINLIDLQRYEVAKWKWQGRYSENRPHTVPKIFGPYFRKNKFKYSIIGYDFQNVEKNKIKFSIILISIEDFSVICFIKPIKINYDELVRNGLNELTFKIFRLPIFPPQINYHKYQIKAQIIGYNPFLFTNFGLDLKDNDLNKLKKEIKNFYFYNDEIRQKFLEITWSQEIQPKFMPGRSITGEKVFFNSLIREIFEIQLRPMIIYETRKILVDATPTYKIHHFFNFFDEYEYYIEDLPVSSFVNLKNYFKIGISSLFDTIQVYIEFGQFLEIQDPYESFSNFISGLYVLQRKFRFILNKMESDNIKPKKERKIYIKTGRAELDFVVKDLLKKAGFWKEFNSESKNAKSWLEVINYFGRLLDKAYDFKHVFRESAQNWEYEVRDMQLWVSENLREFGERHIWFAAFLFQAFTKNPSELD